INYAILPQFWGNGIATEVTKSIIEFGLRTLKLRFIYAEVNNNNTRSIRVMEKAGMLPYDHSSKLLPVHNKPGNSQYLVFNAGEEL
ncbi:MAG: GNAT family N-acetyltransferase, partial [Bacteroidales bacterium]|nr:GNAT family N-acetyltransferase [Bacteroidales bacterium]